MFRLLRGLLLFAAFPAVCIASDATAANIRTEITPISQWSLYWEPHSCLARRDFGRESDKTSLSIEKFGLDDDFQLIVTSSTLQGVDVRTRLTITYGEGREHVINNPLIGSSQSSLPTLFVARTSLDVNRHGKNASILNASPPEAKDIELSWRGNSLVLKTGTLVPLLAEMQKCIDAIYRTWNLDPDEQRALSNPLKPNQDPQLWLRSWDYPTAEEAHGAQSMVTFTLLVGANGVPTDCAVSRSYGSAAFREQTCGLILKRARFKPARNAQGQAVRSAYVDTVNWLVE